MSTALIVLIAVILTAGIVAPLVGIACQRGARKSALAEGRSLGRQAGRIEAVSEICRSMGCTPESFRYVLLSYRLSKLESDLPEIRKPRSLT